MKIKQLELKGFKSFRNHTRVRFEEGISCIVGPNGCGKSNLVDAFLWVMGESAPKHLRSKAMEEVIFAGAGEYPPSSRAEVSLVMEQALSATQSKEVMVTRRLNRDGLSEYLINSCPARLKDVQEIFMDTGAGIHGFSFIEQGAIESFISSRPEQKKLMVESVAGIARFRFRKKEAERKLQLTENNLNRLQDLLNRQATDLKKLKAQSETAQKFKLLKDQKQKTETEITAWDLKKIQESENQVVQELKLKEKAQTTLIKNRGKLLTKLQALNDKRKQARKTQAQLREESAILDNQLILLEKDLAGKKTALKIQKEQLLHASKLLTHGQNLSPPLKDMEENIAHLEQKQAKLKQKWVSLRTEEENINTQHLYFQKEKEEFLKQMGDREQNKALLEQAIYLLEEKLKIQAKAVEHTQTQLEQNTQAFENLLSKKNLLKEEEDKSHQLSFDMSNLIKKETSDLNTLKEEIQKMEFTLKNLREKSAIAYSDLQSFKKRRSLEKNEQTKHFILNTFKEGFYDITQSIELSSPFLEKAVSSFLTLRLSSLFVLKEEEALKALKKVQANKQGGCRFIFPVKPAEDLLSAEKKDIENASGFQFFLEEKARGPKALIHTLFFKTAVVDHLTTALTLKNSHPSWCFITLEGEVISQEGDLINCSLAEENNILKHKDLNKAPLKYKKAKELMVREEESLRKKQALFQSLSQKIAHLNHQEHSFEIQALAVQKDLESLNRETEVNLKEKVRLECEQKESVKKQKELEKEHCVLLEKLKALDLESSPVQKNQNWEEQEKNQQRLRQELSFKKEKLWKDILFFEKELARLKEQKNMLGQERDKLKKEKEQNTLKQEEQKSLILAQEKALLIQEETKGHLVQKIQDKANKINQLTEEEQALETQEGQTSVQIQKVREQEAEEESALNQLKLKKESLTLKKQALIESMDFEEKTLQKTISLPLDFDREKAILSLDKINRALSRVGALNFLALKEYEELTKENQFYQKQYDDLRLAREKLFQVIKRIDSFCSKKFKEVFEEVRGRFSKLWPVLFEGGKADLILTSGREEEGLEIRVQPPGKKIQNMSLLSGGEKAMTAVAVMFSLFLVKPSPFCILDEVDAPLDDNNVTRFRALLSEMTRLSQIILITHNKQSMKSAHVLYGVTMEEKGISKLMSLKSGERMAGPLAGT